VKKSLVEAGEKIGNNFIYGHFSLGNDFKQNKAKWGPSNKG
jgi:hypothetical protein